MMLICVFAHEPKKTFHHTLILVGLFLLPPLELERTERLGSRPWCGQQARCPRTGVFQPWAAVEEMSVAPCCGSDNPLKSPWWIVM
jgi:hypothetical protein